MTREGQVVLLNFPYADSSVSKLRPALILRRLPGRHDDWLVCMISSQLDQAIEHFDEVIRPEDADFMASGLKRASAVRIARLAIVDRGRFTGGLGEISAVRLAHIRSRLAAWLQAS